MVTYIDIIYLMKRELQLKSLNKSSFDKRSTRDAMTLHTVLHTCTPVLYYVAVRTYILRTGTSTTTVQVGIV